MILRGLLQRCPLLLLDTAVLSPLDGTLRVWSYGVWYCCAPSLPLDTAVFSRFNGRLNGMVLRGLVLMCPLFPS